METLTVTPEIRQSVYEQYAYGLNSGKVAVERAVTKFVVPLRSVDAPFDNKFTDAIFVKSKGGVWWLDGEWNTRKDVLKSETWYYPYDGPEKNGLKVIGLKIFIADKQQYYCEIVHNLVEDSFTVEGRSRPNRDGIFTALNMLITREVLEGTFMSSEEMWQYVGRKFEQQLATTKPIAFDNDTTNC